jgi:hypothetical protein
MARVLCTTSAFGDEPGQMFKIKENIAGAQPRHFRPEDGNFSVC